MFVYCAVTCCGVLWRAVTCCVVQAFTADQVAKVLTGFTKLRHYDAELCARLADAAAWVMPQASGVRIAQVMWALAHQRYEQAAVFEAAALQVGWGGVGAAT